MAVNSTGGTTLQYVAARRILTGLVGVADTREIVTVLALLVSLAMVGDAIDRMFKRLMNAVLDQKLAAFGADGARFVGYDAVLIVLVVVLIVLLVHNARRAKRRMHLDAVASASPTPAEVLVLMLSEAKSLDGIDQAASVDSPALQSHSWLMPVIAVDHHKARLRRVIVVASRQSAVQQQPFADLLRRITGNADLCVQSPADYIADPKLRQVIERGVDMENMPQMVDVLDETYRALTDSSRPDHVSERDVMFDVTSGTKLGTVAMTTVALAYDQRMQYCQSAGITRRVTSWLPRFVPAEK